jgi:DNA adenine methylase
LPFLKWPGGKRWLAKTIAEIIGEPSGTYYEPFLGGGAVFFHLRPAKAVLSDRNGELIGVYRQIKSNLEDVLDAMRGLRPSRSRFSLFRAADPPGALERAVRFLYLNRTAFNGMYRVNQKGEFNVPYGCKPGTTVLNRPLLRAAAEALQAATLLHSKFEHQVAKAGKGDVVYCDPPYTVKHDNNGFVRYNESIFSWDDQVRLAEDCRAAARRGARVIVSNARHEPVRKLYSDFTARIVHRNSMVSGSVEGRGSVAEYLFLSKNF